MRRFSYYSSERCTSWIASELMCCGESTGMRYLQRMRERLGYNKRSFVSVGEFRDFYRLRVLLKDD